MSSKVRYKVVKLDRSSCVISDPDFEIIYEKDTIVNAKEGTIGIFCFK